ncbi:MAG: Spy/CpxP family protein refolding chaperone [Desertifilum sp. SIO1I2]|nr:Spy/CpxP family protein refolding chaperone [Desertifilum sp. SIO1I2]
MFVRRVSFVALLAILLGGTSAIAFAQPMPEVFQIAQQGPRNRPENGDRIMQELNLTPQQMQQMQAIRQRYQGQMQSSRQSLRQAHQELQQLMASDAPVSQIRDKHRQVQQLRSTVADLQLENMLEMREVLTLQQRQMLNQRMQQRRRN